VVDRESSEPAPGVLPGMSPFSLAIGVSDRALVELSGARCYPNGVQLSIELQLNRLHGSAPDVNATDAFQQLQAAWHDPQPSDPQAPSRRDPGAFFWSMDCVDQPRRR
jgi:hypothetical protein